jgi:hypothetical protein
MAQVNLTIHHRVPLKVKLLVRLLAIYVRVGSWFPEGLISIEIDTGKIAGACEYRLDKGPWKRLDE